MIAIIDYGAGNVESVRHALERIGVDSRLTCEREEILGADGVILPGVGAFGEAMRQLRSRGLMDTLRRVRASKKPFLGICIGLQLMFEKSEETPGVCGLKFLSGSVRRIGAFARHQGASYGMEPVDLFAGRSTFFRARRPPLVLLCAQLLCQSARP